MFKKEERRLPQKDEKRKIVLWKVCKNIRFVPWFIKDDVNYMTTTTMTTMPDQRRRCLTKDDDDDDDALRVVTMPDER